MAGADGLLSSDEDALVGRRVDKYRVVEVVGRGGMGRVYRAVQENLDREVALKVLLVTKASDPDFVRRFEKEAAVCAKLTHPNTVRVYDFGATEEGLPWIAMEFLRGRTLQQALRAEAPFEPLRTIRLLKPVCGSLAEAHAHHLVHRDLKPGNIVLTRQTDDLEFPRVLDFGLVKELGLDREMTASGALLGSPMYMAPEQVKGEAIDARTDVYALGAILFTMLAGEHPFGRGAAVSMLVSHVHEPVPAIADRNPTVEVPASLEWVVRTCLAKDPAERFASARELARALKICELELHHEVEGPVAMALQDGRLVLPEGIEEPAVTGVRAPLTDLPASPSQATLAEVGPPRRVARLWGLVAALAVVVMVLAAAAWGLGRRSARPGEVPAPAPPPESPATRDVWLTTQPLTAHVERDGVFLGDAPVHLAIPDGERWTVQVVHDGYQTRSIVLDGSQPTLSVRLTPNAPAPAPAPAPSRPARPPAKPPAAKTSGTVPAPAPKTDWTPTSDVRDPWSE